jgi:hypothetical protein
LTNQPPRGDSFYRTLVASGLLLALFALAWGRWNIAHSRDRLFVVEEHQILARASLDRQKADSGRIEAYSATIHRALSGTADRNSPRYAFLTAETERTDKRLQTAGLEMERRKLTSEMHDRQHAQLTEQIETDTKRSDALAVLGFTLTVLGFFLWYLRRQRWMDRSLRSDSFSRDEN